MAYRKCGVKFCTSVAMISASDGPHVALSQHLPSFLYSVRTGIVVNEIASFVGINVANTILIYGRHFYTRSLHGGSGASYPFCWRYRKLQLVYYIQPRPTSTNINATGNLVAFDLSKCHRFISIFQSEYYWFYYRNSFL